MIYLDTATADWEGADGWKIAPAGLAWIGEGFRLKHGNHCQLGDDCLLGDYCQLGNYCRLGDDCRLGDGCRLGDDCLLGDYCQLGDYCRLGDHCRLGNYCQLGNYCRLGDGCRLGDHAQDPIDIGCVDGYRKTLSHVKNVAHVGAGCQWFTLSAALDHWAGREDRVLTRCLMGAAISIAGQKGWRGK